VLFRSVLTKADSSDLLDDVQLTTR